MRDINKKCLPKLYMIIRSPSKIQIKSVETNIRHKFCIWCTIFWCKAVVFKYITICDWTFQIFWKNADFNQICLSWLQPYHTFETIKIVRIKITIKRAKTLDSTFLAKIEMLVAILDFRHTAMAWYRYQFLMVDSGPIV